MDDETKRVAKSKEKSVTFDQLANDFDIDKDNDEVFGDENESGKFPYFDNESLNLSLNLEYNGIFQNLVLNTVKLRVEARVTIQKIKSLGVLQTETCH